MFDIHYLLSHNKAPRIKVTAKYIHVWEKTTISTVSRERLKVCLSCPYIGVEFVSDNILENQRINMKRRTNFKEITLFMYRDT